MRRRSSPRVIVTVGDVRPVQLKGLGVADVVAGLDTRRFIDLLQVRVGQPEQVRAAPSRTAHARHARCADPQWRCGLLHRLGHQAGVGDLVVDAVVGERVVRPQSVQDVEPFAEAPEALATRDPVAVELMAGVSLAEPHVDASVRQHVQRSDVLGDADRVVQRQQQQVETDPDPFSACGDGRSERDDRRRVPVVGEVVFGQPDRLVAERLGMFDERELVAVHVRERSTPRRRVAEAEHQTDVQTSVEHVSPLQSFQSCAMNEIAASLKSAGDSAFGA